MPQSPADSESAKTLGLWDAVSIIVGIVVGTAIFKSPSIVFSNVSTPLWGFAAWSFGALIALCGALTYAELATMHRKSGGEYIFLTKAFGSWLGFLFGWAQLTGVFSGSIGQMAYVFADYGQELTRDAIDWSVLPSSGTWIAAGAVIVVTAVNIPGVRTGKTVQNILSLAKVIGLGMLLVVGLGFGQGESLTATRSVDGPGFGLAMILVLYAFGGWNDSVFVAAEVRDNRRNIPRSLILAIALIAGLYLLVNLAYLNGLGFDGVRSSGTPASAVMRNSTLFGDATRAWAAGAISLLVMISALGAVNGLIFTGSRLYAAMGEDHRVFAFLGRWDPRFGSPIWALCTQALLAVALIIIVGTESGQHIVDKLVIKLGREPLPWDDYGGGFQTLVAATAPVFWSFFTLSGVSLFVFRMRQPEVERPFRVPLYPIVPLTFTASSAWMFWSSVNYAGDLTLLALLPLLIGIPIYLISSILVAPTD